MYILRNEGAIGLVFCTYNLRTVAIFLSIFYKGSYKNIWDMALDLLSSRTSSVILALKLQYFGHLMRKADSLEKTLMLGQVEGKRRGGWQGMRWLDGFIDTMDMSISKFREIVKDRKACYASKSQTQLSDWTTIIYIFFICKYAIFSVHSFYCPPGGSQPSKVKNHWFNTPLAIFYFTSMI